MRNFKLLFKSMFWMLLFIISLQIDIKAQNTACINSGSEWFPPITVSGSIGLTGLYRIDYGTIWPSLKNEVHVGDIISMSYSVDYSVCSDASIEQNIYWCIKRTQGASNSTDFRFLGRGKNFSFTIEPTFGETMQLINSTFSIVAIYVSSKWTTGRRDLLTFGSPLTSISGYTYPVPAAGISIKELGPIFHSYRFEIVSNNAFDAFCKKENMTFTANTPLSSGVIWEYSKNENFASVLSLAGTSGNIIVNSGDLDFDNMTRYPSVFGESYKFYVKARYQNIWDTMCITIYNAEKPLIDKLLTCSGTTISGAFMHGYKVIPKTESTNQIVSIKYFHAPPDVTFSDGKTWNDILLINKNINRIEIVPMVIGSDERPSAVVGCMTVIPNDNISLPLPTSSYISPTTLTGCSDPVFGSVQLNSNLMTQWSEHTFCQTESSAPVKGDIISGLDTSLHKLSSFISDGTSTGCYATANYTVVAKNPIINPVSVTGSSCNANATLSATLGNDNSYSYFANIYSKSGLELTKDTNVNSGLLLEADKKYEFYVKDGKGCISPKLNKTGKIAPEITSLISQPQPCAGKEEGSIQVKTNFGYGNLTIVLKDVTRDIEVSTVVLSGTELNEPREHTFINLRSSDYQVTVTDVLGCSDTETVRVDLNSPPVINSIDTTKESCTGKSDGKLKFNVSTKNGSLFYELSGTKDDDNSDGNFTGLSKGTYNIKITDSKGCYRSESGIELDTAGIPLINGTITDGISCSTVKDGTIKVNATSRQKQAGLIYVLYNSGVKVDSLTTPDFSNLNKGTYSLKVFDAGGCLAQTSGITVGEYNPVATLINLNKYANCRDSLKATLSNSKPITSDKNFVLYKESSSVQNISTTGTSYTFQSDSGKYYVEINYANGCTIKTDDLILDIKKTRLTSSLDYKNCKGVISLAATGNPGTINFEYFNPPNPGTLSIAGSGGRASITDSTQQYVIWARDSYGCTSATETHNISIIAYPNFVSGYPSVDYNNCLGAITTRGKFQNTLPGKSCFHHLINCNSDTISVEAGSTEYNYYPLSNGNYKIFLEDAKGCKSADSIRTLNYKKPQIILNNGYSNCLGRIKADVDVYDKTKSGNLITCSQGGQIISQFSNTLTADFTNLPINKVYDIKAKDAYNCEVVTSATVNSLKANPSILRDTVIYSNCLGQIKIRPEFYNSTTGIVVLKSLYSPLDTFKNAKNGHDASFFNLNDGEYSIEVIDSVGCKFSKNIKVNIKSPYMSYSSGYTDCKADVSLQVKNINPGNITFKLNNVATILYPDISFNSKDSSHTFIGITPGTYYFAFSDGYGCRDSVIKTLPVLIKPSFLSNFPSIEYKNCGVTVNVKANFSTLYGNSISIIDTVGNTTLETRTGTFSNAVYAFAGKENKHIKVELKDDYGCKTYNKAALYHVCYDSTGFNAVPIVSKNKNCTGNILVEAYFSNVDPRKIKPGKILCYQLNNNFTDSVLVNSFIVFGTDTISSFNNLLPGWHTIVIEDMAGCRKNKRVNVNINVPGISLSYFYSDCRGHINVTGSNTNSDSIYFKLINLAANVTTCFDTTGKTHLFTDLGTGLEYKVEITDTLGCVASQYLTIPSIGGIPYFVNGTPEVSYNACLRNISVKSKFNNTQTDSCRIWLYKDGLNGAYRVYRNVKSDLNYVFSNLDNGVYRVQLEDALGCESAVRERSVMYNPPVLTKVNTYENCQGVISAYASVTNKLRNNLFRLINSSNDTIYRKNSTDTFARWPSINPGNYTIFARDGYNCEVSGNTTIDMLEPKPVFSAQESYFENCSGTIHVRAYFKNNSRGTSKIKLSTVASPDFKLLNNVISGNDYFIRELDNAVYKLKIIDGAGCSDSVSKTINVLQGPSLYNASYQYDSCRRKIFANDSVFNTIGKSWLYLLKVKSPVDSICDSISVGTGKYTFYNRSNGNYRFKLIDAAGCSIKTQNTVTLNYEPPKIKVDSAYENCLGKINISAIVSDTTKINIYRINIPSKPDSIKSSISRINSFYNLTSNNLYTIKFTDGYNCQVSESKFIPALNIPPSFVSGYPDRIYENCKGTIKIKGNYFNHFPGNHKIRMYRVGETEGDLNEAIENVIPGNEYEYTKVDTGWYTFRLEDASGCITKGDTIRVQIEDFTLNGAQLIPYENCLGGIKVMAKTGNPGGKIFYLIGDTTFVSPSTTDSMYTFTKLKGNPAKTYNVKVTDSYGCTDMLQNKIMVRVDENPMVQYITPGYKDCKGTIDVLTVFNNDKQNTLQKRKIFLYDSLNNHVAGYDSILPASVFRYEGLNYGGYYVKVVDGYGCQVKSKVVGLFLNKKPSFKSAPAIFYENCRASLAVKPEYFNGQENNRIFLQSKNSFSHVDSIRYDYGTGYYFQGLTRGDYMVKLVDRQGCSDSLMSIIVDTVIAPVFQYVTPSYASCLGRIDVSATFTNPQMSRYIYLLDAPGSINPLATINIGPSVTGHSFENLSNNSYWIKIRDGLGCEILSSEKYIESKTPPKISAPYPLLGYSNGIPFINVRAQIKNYGTSKFKLYSSDLSNLNLSHADSLENFSAIDSFVFVNPLKKYNWAKITDTIGCQSDLMAVDPIDFMIAPEIFSVVAANAKCYGDTSGSIEVNLVANSGSGLKKYSLFSYSGNGYFLLREKTPVPGNNTCLFTGLKAGNYKVLVEDYRGSSDFQDNIGINEPVTPLSISLNNTELKCNGDRNSTVEVIASGGTPAYQYSLENGVFGNNNSFSGLGAGTYLFTVKDNNGCLSYDHIAVNEPDPLVVVSATVKTDTYGYALQCSNTNDGKGLAQVAGGKMPYYLKWYFNSLQVDQDSLHAGTNTVVVTDANNCIVSRDVEISGNLIPDAITLTLVPKIYANGFNQSCNNKGDGRISSVVSGGLPPYTYYWHGPQDFFSQDSIIKNRREGSFNLTVYDSRNCSAAQDYTIDNPPLFHISDVQTVNPGCSGFSTGSLTVSTKNGLAPYQFELGSTLISSNSGTYTFDNLNAGPVFGIVRDALGCSQSFNDTLIEGENISAVFIPTHVLCNGDHTGRITSILYSGPGDISKYSYEWRKSDNSEIIAVTKHLNNVTAGKYNVTIYDESNCSFLSNDIEILQPEALLVSAINSGNATCYNSADGYISCSASGGNNSSYQFSLDGGSTYSNLGYFNGLTQGSYNLSVRDASGCIASSPAYIGYNVISTVIDSIGEVTCTGRKDAYIALHGYGSSSNAYKYSIDGINYSTVNEFRVGAGAYHIYTKDTLSGCTSDENIQVIPDKTPVSVNAILIDSSACKQALGRVDAIISGGSGKYNYKWYKLDNQMALPSVSSLCSGKYKIFVSDKLSSTCIALDTIYVPDRNEPEISGFSIINYPWCNKSTGSIKVNVNSGSQPYSYKWNDALQQSTQTAINLLPGIYKVNVTDKYNCTATDSFALQNGQFTKTSIITKPNCGQSNGSVAFNIKGGRWPYKFDWNGLISNDTVFNNLPAGSYNVGLIDNAGCTDVISFVIGNTDGPEIASVSKLKSYCKLNTGSLSVEATGGVMPYYYEWRKSSDNSLISSLYKAVNISEGKYTLSIRDSKGCISDTIFILEDSVELQPLVKIQVIDSSTCDKNNGTLKASITGGLAPFSYNWKGSTNYTPEANGLHSGRYRVTIADSRGCIESDSILLKDKALFILQTLAQSMSACNKPLGSVTLGIANNNDPYSYSINSGPDIQMPKDASDGLYKAVINNLGSGTYAFIAKDGSGCISDTVTVEITDAEPMQINLLSKKDITCKGYSNGTAEIEVIYGKPPYSYKWNDSITNSPLFNKLKEGVNNVIITDANGCERSKGISIGSPLKMFIGNTSIISPLCHGNAKGNIRVAVNGGAGSYKYLWNTGSVSNEISDVIAGSYHISVIDKNSCTLDSDIIIPEPDLLEINITDVKLPSCVSSVDGSMLIAPVGGVGPYLCNWRTQSGAVLPIGINYKSGIYIAEVKDKNGCFASKPYSLNDPLPVSYNLIKKQSPLCNGFSDGLVVIKPQGGSAPYRILWNSIEGRDSLNEAFAGKHFVRISDSKGCSYSDSIELTQPDAITINTTYSSKLKCSYSKDGIIAASVAGGTMPYSFFWNNLPGTDTAKNLQAGKYIMRVSDANSCSNSVIVNIDAPAVLRASEILKESPKCPGQPNGVISISASGGNKPYIYNLGTGSNSNGHFTNLSANNYSLIITDVNNCISNPIDMSLNDPDTMNVIPSFTLPKCYNYSNGSIKVEVENGKKPYSFSWPATGSKLDITTGLNAGSYDVIVTDANNCQVTKTFKLSNPDSLYISKVDLIQPSCFGLSDGSLNAIAHGGQAPYNLRLKNEAGLYLSSSLKLKQGIYTVEATDANYCNTSKKVKLNSPLKIEISVTIKEPKCHNDSNGFISVSAHGGSGNKFSYMLNHKLTGNTLSIADSLPGTNTFDNSNLIAGLYKVIVNSNSCKVEKEIELPNRLPISINGHITKDPTCFSFSDGSIELDVPSTNYTYNWNGKPGINKISNIPAGDYNCLISDTAGCKAEFNFTLKQPDSLTTDIAYKNPTCFGLSNGSIRISASNGTMPYNYEWLDNPGHILPYRNNLSGGMYNIKVHYGTICYKEVSVKLIQPEKINLITSLSNPKCYGNYDGEIYASATGGTSDFTFSWKNIETSRISSLGNGLKAGTYEIKATDANGCSDNAYVALTEPEKLTIKVVKEDPKCFNENNGIITIKPNGGSGLYSCLMNGISSGLVSSNLVKGKYNIEVTDANSCSVKDSVELVEPAVITYNPIITTPACYGLLNGSVSLNAAGGNAPYSFKLGGNVGGNVFSGLGAGTYSIEITDKNNCKLTDDIVVSEPTALNFNAYLINNPKCHNYKDGKFNVTVNGGTLPYSYKWYSNGLVYNSGDSLTAGNYTIEVSDKNNCSISYSKILANPARVSMSINSINPSCFGINDGKINVLASGGTGTFSYYLNSVLAQANNVNLKGENYKIRVADANGCSVISETELLRPAELRFDSIISKMPACNAYANGSIEIRASGGSGNIKYRLDGREGIRLFNMLESKDYSIQIVDANNCSSSKQFNLSQPEPLSFRNMVVNKPSCFNYTDGSILPDAQGGTAPYTYSYISGSGIVSPFGTNLRSGKYTVTVSDANNCSGFSQQFIDNPFPIKINISKQLPKCFGFGDGSIISKVTGGTGKYKYFWNDSSGDSAISGLYKGIYKIIVFDEKGCKDSLKVELPEPEELLIKDMLVKNPACYGYTDGSLSINITGGRGVYKYLIDDSVVNNPIEKLGEGEYNISVLDTNDCIVEKTARLIHPDSISFVSLNFTDPSCFGKYNGIVNVDANGGTGQLSLKYRYSDTVIFDGYALKAGLLNIEVTDENGCFNSRQAILGTPPAIKTSIINKQPSCFGMKDGSISIIASGGTGSLSYILNNITDTRELSGIGKGIYPVTIKDENNCIFSDSIILNQPDTMIIKNVVLSPPKCYNTHDGSISFRVSGGNDSLVFRLDTSVLSLPFTNLDGGSYLISVNDNKNCYAEKQVFLIQPDTLFLNINKIFNTSCPGSADGAFSVSAKGKDIPFLYSYTDSSNNTINETRNLRAGPYTAAVKDYKGCITRRNIVIGSPYGVHLSSVDYNLPSCFGFTDGSINVYPSGGTSPYYYQWSDRTPVSIISRIGAGNYGVTVSDNLGCKVSQSLILKNPELLTISSANTNNPLCYAGRDGSIEIIPAGGTLPYSFYWSNFDRTQKINNLSAGKFDVTLTDSKNCTTSASYSLTDPPKINGAGLPESEKVCPHVVYTLVPGSEWVSCSWKSDKGFKSNERKIEISEAGKYFLTAVNSDNCVVTDTFQLIVDNSLMNAMFLMKAEAKAEDTVMIIEVSQPLPDYVKWIFPDSVNRIESEYSKETVSFAKAGINKVSLIAYLGACSDTMSKQILILPAMMKKSAPNIDTLTNSNFRSFDISPNPCSKFFNIVASLDNESPVEINITSGSGVVLSKFKVRGLKEYNIRVDVSGFKSGFYLINARSGKDVEQKTLIIK